MIDVTVENFETEVIAASQGVPVLVDFWAPWCGPCKSLGPVLEKLEADYEGRFKLVKIDSDQEQQLAAAFGIRSIPTCVLLMNGQPVDGFMGALPEGQVRAFLDKHVPEAAEPEPEVAAEDEASAPVGQTPGELLEKLQETLAANPADDEARFGYVKLLMSLGRSDDAKVAFAPVIAKAGLDRRLDALQRWMKADDFAVGADVAALEAAIAANRRDFESRFGLAQVLMARQSWTAAMDELLEILMRDKSWSEDLARKTYIAILEIIQPPAVKVADGQVPPEDPVVSSYRRRLSSVVLS